jgi:hypothetical protein
VKSNDIETPMLSTAVPVSFSRLKFATALACTAMFWTTGLLAFVIQPGDSRQVLIETYGYPKSRAEFDMREIFVYPEGNVVLENGRVTELRFTKGGASEFA